ncbi:hypothetical protein GC105_06190 [Alkalibaculum sp. M08DMB]|uniref:Uncharacterized protein n=1 Tax=Alkalibaculum sporogenes TaxID=2655001 RepID=A0A6A7K8G3_9FIRM|nr:hypothetical protein [Alkalibaculum sporogenes]MPW25373.1 hypothetical protein [Alkalibaculum sporogenes]
MIVDLLTLIGLAFFIKIFFNSIVYCRKKDKDVQKQEPYNSDKHRNRLIIHSFLGVLFIVLGRLYVVMI